MLHTSWYTLSIFSYTNFCFYCYGQLSQLAQGHTNFAGKAHTPLEHHVLATGGNTPF